MHEMILSRAQLEGMTKEEVIAHSMLVQREGGADVEKFTSGAKVINYIVAPAIGVTAGEVINAGLEAWARSGKASGQFIKRHLDLLESLPHVVLGGGLALATVPGSKTTELNDAVFAGAAALFLVGGVRWVVWLRDKISDSRTSRDELAQANAKLQAALQAANAQLSGAQPPAGPGGFDGKQFQGQYFQQNASAITRN
jgi:hypothetical protein